MPLAGTQGSIGLQLIEKALGKTTADKQAVAGRQPRIVQGIEEHGLRDGGG